LWKRNGRAKKNDTQAKLWPPICNSTDQLNCRLRFTACARLLAWIPFLPLDPTVSARELKVRSVGFADEGLVFLNCQTRSHHIGMVKYYTKSGRKLHNLPIIV
jgi:hypothetical protein